MKEKLAKPFTIWKHSECVAESGPQLILQLNILAISSLDEPADNIYSNITTLSTMKTPDTTVLYEWGTSFLNVTMNVTTEYE